MARTLSPKERAFVHAYMTDAAGNATQAARLAGYSPKTARAQGSRLLTKVDVRAAVDRRVEQREARGIATAEARDLLASEWLQDTTLDHTTRIQAMRELNRVDGRYSLKLIHSGRLTIEQALERANERLEQRKAKRLAEAAAVKPKSKPPGAGK